MRRNYDTEGCHAQSLAGSPRSRNTKVNINAGSSRNSLLK